MDKITKSFLALVLMLVGLVSAKAGEAPTPPAAPKASALVTDGSVDQYLFNVGAKGFFLGANDWGTRASIDPDKGYKVKITKNADGNTYTLNNEAKGGNSADCQGVDQIWVDGKGRAGDAKWTVTIAEDGSFKLGNTNVTPGFLAVVPSKNDTKLYISDAEEAQDVWIAVSVEDYTAFAEAKAKYKEEYAAWVKDNAKAGDDLIAVAPSTWEGQSGTYAGFGAASERYNGDGSIAAGDVMTQTIEGLKNGKYEVKLELAGSYTSGRGFECPTGDGLAVAFANTQEENLPIVDRGGVGQGEQSSFDFKNVEVTDGVLKYGIKNLAAAGNWYVARVTSIVLTEVAPPAKDAWFNAIDFCFRDKASTVEANKSRTFAVWGADPDDDTNGCIVATAGKNSSATNAQFWIRGAEYVEPTYIGEDKAQLTAVYDKGGFASGTGFKVTMRVKADGEYSAGSQTQGAFQHKSNDGFGTLNVTKEWQTVSFVCIADDARAGFTDLCFNLAASDADRTFYFDDIKITGRGGSEWYVNNEFYAKDYHDKSANYSNDASGKNFFPNPPYVADGDYVEVIATPKGTRGNQTWDAQLFIKIPDEYVGKATKLTMKVQATEAVEGAATSYHATASGAGWGASAAPADKIPFTVGEWTDITTVLNTKVVTAKGQLAATQQVDFFVIDLSYGTAVEGDDNAGYITYKFKNVKFEAAQEDWYTSGKIIAKDYKNGDETYTNSDDTEFPLARYVYDNAGDYVEVVSNANRVDEWDSQIWIEIPEKWIGKKVQMTMDVEATQEVTAAAAYHSFAGGNHWGPSAGDGVPFSVGKFTTVTRILNTEGVKCNKSQQVKYYVLNLSNDAKGEGTGITYKFKNIAWSEAPVDSWVDLIPLQDFEAGYTGAEDEPIYFLSKENVIAADDTHRSRIVEGAGKDSKNGIEFRTQGGSANWDSQFEIRFPYQLPNGTTFKLEFDYKVDATANFGTQAWDGGVGSYATGGTAAMTVSAEEVGTWKHYKQEYKVNYTRKDGDNVTSEGLRWNVFDMAQSGQPNAIVFIDNISVQVPEGTLPFKDGDGKEIAPDYLSATEYPIYTYIDPTTLDWTDNIFTNGDVEGEDMSSFISKVNDDEDALLLPASTKVFKESNQVMVKTAAREKDPADETKYLGNDHYTQFFVRLPYALKKGNKYFFSVDYISNKVADVESQTHAEPGEWKSNNGVGKITTGSTSQTLADYFTADNDMRTIAFNLASATEGGTFYFDNFVFKVVKDEEADIKAFTQTWDETSKWNETLALNVAYDNGRNAETEGCTAESVKALDDAMAAGKAILQPAEGAEPATKDAIAAAARAIEDAIAGLEKGKPELAYTDLTKEMFFQWNAADETAEALEASNCDYNIGTSTGQPYGLSTVNHDRFADLSAYNTIELTATEGEPRLLFNRIENEGTVFAEVPRDAAKYETVVDNGDGSKTYVIDIAAIVAEYGFAHLHAIKGANWANTTVTEIKLGYAGEKPALPIPTAIEGVETAEDALQDGKYFINGQIVIVKNGVKYNAAGVAIK